MSRQMSQMEANKVEAALMQMRDRTHLTGALFEAQLLQLKNWGLLASVGAKRVEITWENSDRKDKRLYINAVGAQGWDHGLTQGLDRSVKHLLGNDWSLILRTDGRDTFLSPGTPIVDPPGGA